MRTRDSAVTAVENLLKNLPMHKKKEDALRMVDREIGGLLAHPASPMANTYQVNERVLFPRGLEATFPEKDIILILNSTEIDINHRGKTQKYTIPKPLRNPEKGVASIIGKELAQELFDERGKILKELALGDSSWNSNIEANNKAKAVLESYDPSTSLAAKKTIRKDSVKEDPVTPSFSQEDQKILDTFLSALISVKLDKKTSPTWSEHISKSTPLREQTHIAQLNERASTPVVNTFGRW